MTAFTSHRSSSKMSLPALPILVIGWMIALASAPGALAMPSMLRMIPDATVRASNEAVAALDDGSDSADDDFVQADLAPLSDPSVKKADPAADPMQGAQPLRIAHRSHASHRHMHRHSHRKLVRSHH